MRLWRLFQKFCAKVVFFLHMCKYIKLFCSKEQKQQTTYPLSLELIFYTQ